MNPGPLIFQPILRPKIWGGRRLSTLLGKALPDGAIIGESWECADLGDECSVVARGPMAGRALHQLMLEWGADLLGRAAPVNGRFPLIIKFLDAVSPLSIQVHPGVQRPEPLRPDEAVKHEAWFVLAADPGSVIYRGLKPDVTPTQLRACLERDPDGVPALLNTVNARAGDHYYLPGGTVHALGGGLVVAEVQTPSDTTFRLYDWGRTRPVEDAGLHIEQAIACIDPTPTFKEAERRSHVTSVFTTVTRLVTCPSFILEKVRFAEQIEQDIPYAELVVWIVLEGSGEVTDGSGTVEKFRSGEVIILPAGLKKGRLRTHTPCTWIEVTIPVESDLAQYSRPAFERLFSSTPHGHEPIQLRVDRKPPLA